MANVEYTRPFKAQTISQNISITSSPGTTIANMDEVDPDRTIIVPCSFKHYSTNYFTVGWAQTNPTTITFYHYADASLNFDISVCVIELANKPKSIQIISGQPDGATSSINAVDTSKATLIAAWNGYYSTSNTYLDFSSPTAVVWNHGLTIPSNCSQQYRGIVVDP